MNFYFRSKDLRLMDGWPGDEIVKSARILM